jgi:hypothetical protein
MLPVLALPTDAPSKRRAAAVEPAPTNLLDLPTELLIKIVVREFKSGQGSVCQRMMDLCFTDRAFGALCDEDTLFDSINKKLGYYGPQGELKRWPIFPIYAVQSARSWLLYCCENNVEEHLKPNSNATFPEYKNYLVYSLVVIERVSDALSKLLDDFDDQIDAYASGDPSLDVGVLPTDAEGRRAFVAKFKNLLVPAAEVESDDVLAFYRTINSFLSNTETLPFLDNNGYSASRTASTRIAMIALSYRFNRSTGVFQRESSTMPFYSQFAVDAIRQLVRLTPLSSVTYVPGDPAGATTFLRMGTLVVPTDLLERA